MSCNIIEDFAKMLDPKCSRTVSNEWFDNGIRLFPKKGTKTMYIVTDKSNNSIGIFRLLKDKRTLRQNNGPMEIKCQFDLERQFNDRSNIPHWAPMFE